MNENNNREENGFEAYIEREFIENTEEFELPKERKKSFRIAFAYALVFVLVLIVIGITGTYAYYNVDIQNTSSTTSINSSTACFNVKLSDSGPYTLNYNYPITDDFAKEEGKITPMTITITNNCNDNVAIPYKLYLTTYPDGGQNNHMDNSRVSMQVKKGNDVISSFNPIKLSATSAANDISDVLKNSVNARENTLKEGKYILIDSDTVSHGAPKTYSFKFWINYGSNKEESVSGDFKALVSAIIN